MRSMILAAIAMLPCLALADEVEDAHRQAVAGRNSYWNCLAREYAKDSNKNLSGPDFNTLIAGVCPSERQNFRVMLVGYLCAQFPDVDAGPIWLPPTMPSLQHKRTS